MIPFLFMLITDFDFELPERLIAQEPLKERADSRMLIADRGSASLIDGNFFDLPNYLRKDDLIVLNDTKVFPARIFGKSETGAKIELFLVRETEGQIWETLARPARRLKPGKKIDFNDQLSAEVLHKTPDGHVFVKFTAKGNLENILDQIGKTPLPPYIKRGEDTLDKDRERYQTVFAKNRGAIAAPTAGLHFTPKVLNEIEALGAEIAKITLHVGYGTFEPVRVNDLTKHSVLPERCEISEIEAEKINKALKDNRRIIAIGTTTTRALESAANVAGKIESGSRYADLTITPGYKFKMIKGLLTNFHLPQSSLLVLVSTFGGYDFIMNGYRHAVASEYRFYSYGDCMLVL